MSDYSFGDTTTAALRLGHVARVFEASSRAFLAASAPAGCELAVDLGCGPGHTTRLLRELLGGARVVGLEASEAFLREARAVPCEGVDFVQHDVLSLPFPTGPADLLHARLLVSHLREPAAAIAGFASQLRPSGRLLLDEVERIDTEDEAFRRYLALVEARLAARGQCLYVGPRLAALTAGLRVRESRVVRHRVDPGDAATMFSLNLAFFRNDEDRRAMPPDAELEALAQALAKRREGGGAPIEWGLRQLVIEA